MGFDCQAQRMPERQSQQSCVQKTGVALVADDVPQHRPSETVKSPSARDALNSKRMLGVEQVFKEGVNYGVERFSVAADSVVVGSKADVEIRQRFWHVADA